MWAAHEGHVEVARFLLEKGAFVDYPDEVRSCDLFLFILTLNCCFRMGGLHSCRPVRKATWILSIY